MLEVTTAATEEKLGVDFADVYRSSEQYRWSNWFHIIIVLIFVRYLTFPLIVMRDLLRKNYHFRVVESSIKNLSVPPPGSEPLKFSSTYSQDPLSQFFICFWKQNLIYWRSPQYNAVRLAFTVAAALILGSVFWDIGSKR